MQRSIEYDRKTNKAFFVNSFKLSLTIVQDHMEANKITPSNIRITKEQQGIIKLCQNSKFNV